MLHEKTDRYRNSTLRHILPFVLWIGLMLLLPDTPSAYAWRSGLCLLCFILCKTWRGYALPRFTDMALGMVVGFIVCALWILPESAWFQTVAPRWAKGYRLVALLPPWSVSDIPSSSIYNPEQCAWPLLLTRLLGSALVIALIEEFFWRGWLARFLVSSPFMNVQADRIAGSALWISSLLFAFEHERWLAGLMAGLAYALLYRCTSSITAACVAHVTTNLLLGLYVLKTGAFFFW